MNNRRYLQHFKLGYSAEQFNELGQCHQVDRREAPTFSGHELNSGALSGAFNDLPSTPGMDLPEEIVGYDDGILYIDTAIEKLIGQQEGAGVLQDTVGVITSDHEEAFGEQSYFTHTNALEPQLVRVPLVIWSYGRCSESVVSQIGTRAT